MKYILMIAIVGMLTGCVSGVTPADTYVGKDGKVTVIESDREMCQRTCNEDYSRCMDTQAAEDNSGVKGPSGFVGASADCRIALHKCLPPCKAE